MWMRAPQRLMNYVLSNRSYEVAREFDAERSWFDNQRRHSIEILSDRVLPTGAYEEWRGVV